MQSLNESKGAFKEGMVPYQTALALFLCYCIAFCTPLLLVKFAHKNFTHMYSVPVM